MNLMGKDKEGKTHTALEFSKLGPLALFDFDFGTEGVAKKFIKSGSPIVHARYPIVDEDEGGETHADRWKRFRRDWKAARTSKRIKVMVIDQGASLYQQIRLAYFGRLSKIPPQKYDVVNAELNKILSSIYATDKSLIILHPLKAEFKRGEEGEIGQRTGRLVMDGWSRIPYLVQVNAQAYRAHSPEQKETARKQDDPDAYRLEPPAGKFGLKIVNCRHNPDVAGSKLFGNKLSPQALLDLVFAE